MSPLSGPGQSIGLCMIVRDEESVIERCIESVRPLISSWTICDTGSSDSTPTLVEGLLADLPGRLHRRPWVDFGANRSELMDLASGTSDYLLLLDADMTIERLDEMPELFADAYLISHAGPLAYAVQRLVNGSRRWWFEGRTHEHLAAEGEYSERLLDALVVHHHADGGARESKLERDSALLSEELRADPTNGRATFYLAQTRRDMGDLAGAIDLYRRRAAQGGWEEEAFYANFQLGVLLAHDGRRSEGVTVLVEAHRRRPTRIEPLLELARLCRVSGQYLASYRFARRGLELPVPDDILFIHRDAHEWGLLFELSIAAFWIGESAEALAACDRLLGEGRLPANLIETVETNRSYCADGCAIRGATPSESQRVHRLNELATAIRFGELRLDVEPDWPQFNPSIAAHGDGFRVIVRTASYRALPGNRYSSLHPDGRIHTINYLAELDHSLALESVAALEDVTTGPREPDAGLIGYEDLRLVETPAGVFSLATVGDRNPEGRLEMALLRIEGTQIVETRVLSGPDPARHERNWMPLVVAGELYLVYSLGPTVVFHADVESGELSKVAEHTAPAIATRMRGGSQGVRVDRGHLFCSHEVLFAETGRHYVHRLALLDDDLHLAGVSPRFTFAGERLEFCAGLARRDSELVLSFGVGDAHAGLASCLEAELMSLLRDPG